MAGETIQTNSQQFNPLAGDIQFNPAQWGLTMRDIEAASLNVKTAIYSGNINLTADFYQEVKALSDQKYNAVNTDGSITTTRLTDTDMLGKDPGLYMNQSRMGFWDGTEWKAWIGNSGNFSFDGDLDNFIRWNGTELIIQGDLRLTGGVPIDSILDGLGDMAYEDVVELAKLGTTLITGGLIRADVIQVSAIAIGSLSGAGALAGKNQAGSADVTFNYAGAASKGGNANDTNLVNGVSSSSISQGAGRANTAINSSNRYATWLQSSELAAGSSPSTGVIIDSAGIRGYAGGTKNFEISSSGSASFRGSIDASTINGSTINTFVNQIDQVSTHMTSSSFGFYVDQFGSSKLISMTAIDDTGYRGIINFYDQGTYVGRIGGINGTFVGVYSEANMLFASGYNLTVGTTKHITLNSSGQIDFYASTGSNIGYLHGNAGGLIESSTSFNAIGTLSNTGNCNFNASGTGYISIFNGKLRIPVGSNLY